MQETDEFQKKVITIACSNAFLLLRKSVIYQTLEIAQCKVSTRNRHECAECSSGCLRKYIDRDMLECMKEISMSNATIVNLFNAHRNLIARCMKDHGVTPNSCMNYTND